MLNGLLWSLDSAPSDMKSASEDLRHYNQADKGVRHLHNFIVQHTPKAYPKDDMPSLPKSLEAAAYT